MRAFPADGGPDPVGRRRVRGLAESVNLGFGLKTAADEA